MSSPVLPYYPGTSPAAPITPQAVTNINNGVLNDPLEANGQPINNAGCISYADATIAALGQTNNVYIAVRTDGREGSGFELDPFDGSTAAKLDILLPTIPANTEIKFAKGTFLTTTGIVPKTGWIIRGSGKAETTIKASAGVVTAADQIFWVIGGELTAIQYFEISDLTIDCNRANQPAYTAPTAYNSGIRAFQVNVYSGRAENVRVLGVFQREGPPAGVNNEGFPFHFFHDIGPQVPDVTHYEYRVDMVNCESISNRGYAGGMGIVAQGTTQGREFTSRIHNSLVYDNPDGVGMGAHEVSDCVLVNSGGINFDTWPNNGIKIHGNRIVGGIGNGINGYSGYANKNVWIYNNNIESAAACINMQAIDLPVGSTTVFIHDNFLKVTGSAYPIGIGDNFVGEIHNNVVNEPLGLIPFYFGVFDGVRVYDNFHEDGSPTPLFYHRRYRQADRKSWTLDIATSIATDTPDEVTPKILLGQVTDYNTRRLTLEIKTEGADFAADGKIEINAHNYQAISWYLHPGNTLSGHAKFEIWTKNVGTNTAIWLKYAGNLSPLVGRVYVNLIAGNVLDPTVITPSGYANLPGLGTLALAAIPSGPFISVDKNRGNDDTAERLNQDMPASTIQGALDAATSGDEIIIRDGFYDEEVTVKAGTYVITLLHGAIWKQTADAACLKSANVTCDFTINGDLYTSASGAAAIAMVAGHSGVTVRMNGKIYASGTGTTYVNPCGAFHEDGTLYLNGDIVLGTAQTGIFSNTPETTAALIVTGIKIAAANHSAVVVRGAGSAAFVDCTLSSTLTQTVSSIGRPISFTRCTIRCTGLDVFTGSGTVLITLHEFNHLISSTGSTEFSTGISEIILDGISFTNKPKASGTALSGKGYLWLDTEAATQDTGWSAMTGSAIKTSIAAAAAGTASAGYVQAEAQAALNRIAAFEARMKGYDAVLIANGLIGA